MAHYFRLHFYGRSVLLSPSLVWFIFAGFACWSYGRFVRPPSTECFIFFATFLAPVWFDNYRVFNVSIGVLS